MTRPRNIAEILTIKSAVDARAAIRKLDRWADNDVDCLRKALRSATLAASRADRSHGDRAELARISLIYRRFVHHLTDKLHDLERSQHRSHHHHAHHH